MISPDKIEEWIHEVEERPVSAALIIQYIANRLSELATRNEELAAQNIELLSGRKVEEYENRIASLEYQLDLLKRQVGGEVILPTEAPTLPPIQELLNVFLYNPLGQVLRLEMDPGGFISAQAIARLTGELSPDRIQPSMLVTTAREELLFIFDSGRTVARPVTQIPLTSTESLDWKNSFIEEPHIREELAVIQPIAKMPLYELCIQASRRGYVKKIKTSLFTSHLGGDYIGTGVKLPADKTCGLIFANQDELFVMVSQEGYIFSMPAVRLPTAIEEVIHLSIIDHIIAAFTVNHKSAILFVTQNGKVVHRDTSWLEEANSYKTKGQAILSKERREAGTRIISACGANDNDWGVFLDTDGVFTTYKVGDLLATGSLAVKQDVNPVHSFAIFQMPEELQYFTLGNS